MPHGPFIRKKVRDILRPAAINELQAALENAPTLAEGGGGGGGGVGYIVVHHINNLLNGGMASPLITTE